MKIAQTLMVAAALISTPLSAAEFFVNNPTGNSVDFRTAATNVGATVETAEDFDGISNGVTIDSTNFTPTSGFGPGQANTTTAPVSAGEGPSSFSTYLSSGRFSGQVTLTFVNPVRGFGFSTIDLFNPGGFNDIGLSVFSNTGALLGSTTAADFNFQRNNTYFMGFLSDASNVGSFVLTNPFGGGDRFAVDNIVVARTVDQVGAVPEPSTWAVMLLGFGFVGVALRSARRRQKFTASFA